jgi:hypothetical protein
MSPELEADKLPTGRALTCTSFIPLVFVGSLGFFMPTTKIFKEDREEYILSLRQCQNEETNQPFLDFMARQLKKSLSIEIERFNVSRKKGFSFMF